MRPRGLSRRADPHVTKCPTIHKTPKQRPVGLNSMTPAGVCPEFLQAQTDVIYARG